ncbi:hypothetical protein BJ742DRAFT_780454 [Cladochytrium replicatum]|nr:hypothetical protein BJ742DRAFT_780454 [Cladochytrium replicatum]
MDPRFAFSNSEYYTPYPAMQSQRIPDQKSSSRPFYVLTDPDPTVGSTLQFIEPEELQRIHQLREIAQRRAHEEQFRRQYAERIRRQKERDMLAAAELRRQQELYQREVDRLRELKRLSRQQQQQHQHNQPQSQQIPPWAAFPSYGSGPYAPHAQVQPSPFFGATPGVQYMPYDYLPFGSASGPHRNYRESYPYTHSAHDRGEAVEAEENQSRELDDKLAEFLLPFFFTKKLGGNQSPLTELREQRRARKIERGSFGRSKNATIDGSEAASDGERMETDELKSEPQPFAVPADGARIVVEDVTSQVDTASVGEPEITEATSDTCRKEIPPETEAEQAERQSAAAKIQHAWRVARPHVSSSLKCRTLDALASEVDKLAFLNERRALAAPLAFVNADESGALVTGAKENKAFMQHEDALTRILLKLDTITSDGDPKVRDKRREVIARVQRHLDALDAHKRQQRELKIVEAAKRRSQDSTRSVDPDVRKEEVDGATSDMEADSPASKPTVTTKATPIAEEQPVSAPIQTPIDATTQTVMAKVRYNNVLRQFALSETKWVEFVARIRKVHSIPDDVAITVTHTDEDGDVIAIDSDEELVDLIAFVRRCAIRVVRFEAA